jgi:hypothetical protein
MVNVHELRLSEKGIYSTIRIEFQTIDKKVHVGTGFLFEFSCLPNALVVISNRHIAEKAISGGNKADSNDNLIPGEKIPFIVNNFSKKWIYHPDPSIDLAMMPIGELINYYLSQGNRPFYIKTISSTIPNPKLSALMRFSCLLVYGNPLAIFSAFIPVKIDKLTTPFSAAIISPLKLAPILLLTPPYRTVM